MLSGRQRKKSMVPKETCEGEQGSHGSKGKGFFKKGGWSTYQEMLKDQVRKAKI